MRTPLLIAFQIFAVSALAQNLPANYPTLVQAEVSKVVEWRRHFHENPELSNREFKTAAYVADVLRGLGLEVKTGVAKTGVVAILKGGKPGPVMALRADMDGLPVHERNDLPFRSKQKGLYYGDTVPVMHACGHDAHMAILLGTAEVLSKMKKDLAGTVVFLFQPAEEGAPKGEEGGAELMVKEGVLNNPKVEVAFGLHIKSEVEAGTIAYRPAGFMAGVQDFKMVVKGKQAHGAYPWQSTDPVVTASEIVLALQTIVSRNLKIVDNPGVVSVGAIHGGVRNNIIPEQVEMIGTVRTFTQADRDMFRTRIKTIAEKMAEANNCTVEFNMPFNVDYPVTFNDTALTALMIPSLQKAANGKAFHYPPVTGAEDFSFYQEKVPGLFFFLGGMPKGMDPEKASSHHTPDFFIDESGFDLGVKAFCQLVFDYAKLKK
jgi:amidohydrolase